MTSPPRHLPTMPVPKTALQALCSRWQITQLALFGSVLRDDFQAESDVDVLVTFDPAAAWTLFDLVTLRDELSELFGRTVDLVEKSAIERSANTIRRRAILESPLVIYE